MARHKKSALRKSRGQTRTGRKIEPALFRPERPRSNKTPSQFLIVGIGASAGGLEAIQILLKSLPEQNEMAFVIIQHLDPNHTSLGPEIFSRATRIPILEATQGMRIKAGHIYLSPPKTELTINQGALRLVPIHAGNRGQPVIIDSFFRSLAFETKGRAIGVILSGTGSDGTLGLEAIRQEGGVTIAQDPQTAKHRGMPDSAIASGSVDLILAPHEIASELVRISTHSTFKVEPDSTETVPPSESSLLTKQPLGGDSAFRKILNLIRIHTKVDFSGYKYNTILRRIQRRLIVTKCDTLDEYIKYMQKNPSETKELYDDILINVTEFFRDEESFNALRNQVFPELVKHRQLNSPIRIWVPGCSTGEEPYSIAILLLEFLSRTGGNFPVQIFGTDISEEVIQKARIGLFPLTIEQKISKERLDLFFIKTDVGYKIERIVRDLCLFSRHDFTADPPFSKLDLISCRNVFIYFDSSLQKRVSPTFHFALNPGGFLFLGRSEGLSDASDLFSILDRTHKIFIKSDQSLLPKIFRSSFTTAEPERIVLKNQSALAEPTLNLQRQIESAAFSRYATPSVLINADMDILHFQGRTAPFFETFSGLPSRGLLQMARREIVPALRALTHSAIEKSAPARKENLSILIDGRQRTVSLEVIPSNPPLSAATRNYVVFFEVAAEPPNTDKSLPKNRGKVNSKQHLQNPSRSQSSRRLFQLEEELAACKISQISMNEEYHTIQEELTSSNEELQCANEELETSKEELQSSNEELTTVNDELQIRNADLVVISSDLNNLFSNIEIPIVIVGIDRRIRRFTPKSEVLFNLIATDIGRPLNDIRPNFECNLDGLVGQAIELLTLQETEVKTRDGRWMRVQVRPYRTIDNRIDGAVVSLVDITFIKEDLNRSQIALHHATSVADTLHLPMVVLDSKLCFLSANAAFTKLFDIKPQEKVGADIFSLLGGVGWKTPNLRLLLDKVSNYGEDMINFEIETDLRDLGRRILHINGKRIFWDDDSMPKALLMSLEDVTERRVLERMLERSEMRFRTLFESAHDSILILDAQGTIEFANKQALALLNYDLEDLQGKHFESLIPYKYRVAHAKAHEAYMATAPQSRPMGGGIELYCLRKDGTEMPVDISLNPMKIGAEISIAVIIRNITEVKKLAVERQKLLEQERLAHAAAEQARIEAERANEIKDNFLATLSHELRTPLTSILSWAQLIQRQKYEPARLAQAIQIIEQSARTQGQLIDDLLDISRIHSGKLAINFGEVDPAKVTIGVIDAVRPIADKKNIQINFETTLKDERIWGDSDRLQQIVWNLLTNAIKFSSEGGRIQVQTAPTQSEGKKFVSIRVSDQGKGIPPEFIPKLFERFRQVDSSSVRLHGGLGLGLAIVSELTQLHGGFVQAESQGLGHGSTFSIILPLKLDPLTWSKDTLESSVQNSTKSKETTDLSGLKVLLVEDDMRTLEAIQEVLESYGAIIMPCDSVAKALAEFKVFKPQVIVSDIAMPYENGYSLIRKIRAFGPDQNGNVKAVALTAYANKGDIKKALNAGFNAHISKPFDVHHLGDMIFRLANEP